MLMYNFKKVAEKESVLFPIDAPIMKMNLVRKKNRFLDSILSRFRITKAKSGRIALDAGSIGATPLTGCAISLRVAARPISGRRYPAATSQLYSDIAGNFRSCGVPGPVLSTYSHSAKA